VFSSQPSRPTDGEDSSEDEAPITSQPAYNVEAVDCGSHSHASEYEGGVNAPDEEGEEEEAGAQQDEEGHEQEEEQQQQATVVAKSTAPTTPAVVAQQSGRLDKSADAATRSASSKYNDDKRPPWLHGVSLGKDEDRALLQDPATGEYPDGWFFVAELGQDSSNYPGHVLNINFRGKATRHLVKTDEATGFLLVNKKAYGDFATVAHLVDAITQKPLPPNWPVFASHPVVANTN